VLIQEGKLLRIPNFLRASHLSQAEFEEPRELLESSAGELEEDEFGQLYWGANMREKAHIVHGKGVFKSESSKELQDVFL